MARKPSLNPKSVERKRTGQAVTRLEVQLDSKQRQMLVEFANVTGLSLHQVTASALQQYLNTLPQAMLDKLSQSMQADALLAGASRECTTPTTTYPGKGSPLPWIKLWTADLLYGSIAYMPDKAFNIWVRLLCVTARQAPRDGILRYGVGQPMPRQHIATSVKVKLKTLEWALDIFKKDCTWRDGQPRIREWEDGTLEITSFAADQAPSNNSSRQSTGHTDHDLQPAYNGLESQQKQTRKLANRWPDHARAGIKDHQKGVAKVKAKQKAIARLYDKATVQPPASP